MSIARWILEKHLVEGRLIFGEEIGIRIDQTLTQDATGTMAYLQFEALGVPKVRTELSVSYVDHNISPSGKQNIEFLSSFADKYGILFSKPGNGICHQVHLERFAKPGATLLGSDSHTPTAGGIGCLAIGAGGLDIAAAMAGQAFYLKVPRVVGIKLVGRLNEWVSAKDIILHLLSKYTVKGGVGNIFEYFGDGVITLTVPERSTITNMGAELGLTTSIFPSDEVTKEFLFLQGREKDYVEIENDLYYDETIEIDLSMIEPMIACPSSPDNVKMVKDVEGGEVSQVIIGSCTNSSYKDLALVANVLKDSKVADGVNLLINPGSKQVMKALEKEGLIDYIIRSGAQICEAACLGCIGMGQSPEPDTITLRTFNRNFKGRTGTKEDLNHLCSPEIAIASAINGKITDPRNLGSYPTISMPLFDFADEEIAFPKGRSDIIRGEMIAPLPLNKMLDDSLEGEVLIKVGDNITTDDIMPAGEKIIPLRSHIPKISEFVFHTIDGDFVRRAKLAKGGFIVGGDNYGQGSSREHAALAPMYLGVKTVIAKSFARIHKANLVNFGIIPLEFTDKEDYDRLEQGMIIELCDVKEALKNKRQIQIKDSGIKLGYNLSKREIETLIEGGTLNFVKNRRPKGRGVFLSMLRNRWLTLG